MLSLPLLTPGCILEPICTEGSTRCTKEGSQFQAYFLCTDNQWIKLSCPGSSLCLNDECVDRLTCEAPVQRCLSLDEIEICPSSENPMIMGCGEGFFCNAEACDRDESCCVERKSCSETATRCLNLKTVEICTASEVADIEACGDGFVCDAEACAQGQECCVEGEICQETKSECFDDETLKLCLEGKRPSMQACPTGEKCYGGECAVPLCRNHRLDPDEEAVDCGGVCTACIKCRTDDDCGDGGFCDSACGYLCSKRCRTDDDCNHAQTWDGDYCRDDGRCSPKVFETIWKITEEELSVVLPFDIEYPDAKCDFQILWGDEAQGTEITALPRVTDCINVENRTHYYAKPGSYHVKIIGTYDGWGAFGDINVIHSNSTTAAAPKLHGVVSFGPVALSREAFRGATKLSVMPLKDIPNASELKTLASTFRQAYTFNAPIGHWDTSQVTDMERMFYSAGDFNQPIDNWNTSQVTDMERLFVFCRDFNQPIGSWDTSQVTDMGSLFLGARTFNQPIGSWDTSQVTDMCSMFDGAEHFNQPIDTWDVSQVQRMYNMFKEARAFDQPIANWNTSQVTDMGRMFDGAEHFNQPIGSWDVSLVQHMYRIFKEARAFDQSLLAWTLKAEVKLSDIFSLAGMSDAHLCALKAKGGEWATQWIELGTDTLCE